MKNVTRFLAPLIFLFCTGRPDTFQIYNVMGQVMKTFRIDQPGMVKEIELFWGGRNDAGEEVASGTYFLVVDTPSGRQTLTLIRIH